MVQNVDYLTGLCGNGSFLHECDKYVREGTRKLAFITNDISNFKYINDLYSVEEGDRFIVEMANFFYANNPACLVACRTGCDQFRGLFDLTGKTNDEEVERIIQMNSTFEKMMSAKYPDVFLHVYTGIYFLEDGETDTRLAIDRAHMAKKLTKGKFDVKCQVYTAGDFKSLTDEMETSNMFLRACEQDRLLVYLQPKYSVKEEKVVGAEALVRLLDAEQNIVPPGRFIPVLEKTGMIGKLDEIMLEKIFALQKRWLDAGYSVVPISVNISPIEFSRENFTNTVIALQQKYNVPPHLIELEVLESTITDAVDSVINSINTLRNYGFTISIDDFGSGYSCLNQIASIPADVIKLDRVFAYQGLSTEKGRKVVKALIQLLHDIDCTVVFEGIETQEERDLAYEYNCDVIQGFFYSKPIPAPHFEVEHLN